MSDLILLFLILDGVALLVMAAVANAMPPAAVGLVTTILSGLALLLCLPPLLLDAPMADLTVPIGPPGLTLHFALDPLSVCFLVIALLAATAIAAFQATSVQPPALVRVTAFCIGGTILSLLAADGAALTIGLAATCAAIGYGRNGPLMLVPLLLLAAVCLLTPPGYAPRFDAIRAAPIDPDRATIAAGLAVAAVGGLMWPPTGLRCWTRDALTAGVLIPFGLYLLLRLIADLSFNGSQAWWGLALLLAGGAAAAIQGWLAATDPDIDTAIAALMRRQAGLAMTAVGLALIARSADLPGSATYALGATYLAAIGASLAGTLATLSAHTIGTSAGTYRIARLGGLINAMPGTSAALSAGLLTLSALPASLGFATLWLSFQAILTAPRIAGLSSQLPLAWAAAAIALSAALTTAASLRIIGIAILGRPRTPRGAGATETPPPIRTMLLALAVLALVADVLPGPVLWLLADPAVHALTGLASNRGLALLSTPGALPGYLALPVLALLTFAIGLPILLLRWSRRQTKAAGPWTEGMQMPVGLPFGDPSAQSAGTGFLPALPKISFPRLPRLPAPAKRHVPSAAGIWLLIAAFATVLLFMTAIS